MPEALSANTLFHFTPSLINLENILKNGLYVRYSLENYESLIEGESEIAFPMTCFCDIPISKIEKHTNNYGKYAIGLTKEWGINHGVSPVLYSYPKSNTAKILNGITKDISSFFDVGLEKEDNSGLTLESLVDSSINPQEDQVVKIVAMQSSLRYFIKYIKPYKGKMYRNNKYIEVNFYEEQEWRYLPEQSILDNKAIKDSYATKYYKDPISRRAINMKLVKHVKLSFHPSDIRFIVVKKDEEIPMLLESINSIFEKQKNVSSYDLKLLGTRLISLEQVVGNI